MKTGYLEMPDDDNDDDYDDIKSRQADSILFFFFLHFISIIFCFFIKSSVVQDLSIETHI